MPTERNCYVRESEGRYIEEPLMVTIALEEYRSLVQENIRYQERVIYLESRLYELNKPKGCELTQ